MSRGPSQGRGSRVRTVTVGRSSPRYRSLVTRICRSCERQFEPSSRHLDCPACRSRNHCRCGNPKQLKSETCWSCWLARGQADSANHHWKGGRTTHQAGYLMIRLRDHPRAKTNGYVFEHIVVMESMLRRPMSPDESVHHRNGVRDDNRPENLELWVRPQPSGIRKEDAVAWAREILERYGEPG
jgi:HNH endonuclease